MEAEMSWAEVPNSNPTKGFKRRSFLPWDARSKIGRHVKNVLRVLRTTYSVHTSVPKSLYHQRGWICQEESIGFVKKLWESRHYRQAPTMTERNCANHHVIISHLWIIIRHANASKYLVSPTNHRTLDMASQRLVEPVIFERECAGFPSVSVKGYNPRVGDKAGTASMPKDKL